MVPYLRIICVVLLVRPAQTATLQAIKATGRSDRVLRMDIPVRIVGLLSLVISAKLGVIFFAISEIVVEYFGLVLYGIESNNLIQYNLKEIAYDLGINTVHALFMGIIVYLFGYYAPLGLFPKLLLQVALGGIIYITTCKVFKNQNFSYMLDMIRKRRKAPHTDN